MIESSFRMCWFLAIFFLSFTFTHLSETSHAKKLPSAIVIGTVYCDTCFQEHFSKSRHFISGATVGVECEGTNSSPSFRNEVITNKHGKFSIHLPFSVIKLVKTIKRCSVKLIKSSEPYCAVASTATSSSLHFKSKNRGGTHIFSAGFFTFKPLKQPDICIKKLNIQNSMKLMSSAEFFFPAIDKDQFPFPPLFPPIIPPIIPPNPFQPPPSIFPPIFPSPPPSIFPPIFPSPPPSIFPPIFPSPPSPPPSIFPPIFPSPQSPPPSIFPPIFPSPPSPPPSIFPPIHFPPIPWITHSPPPPPPPPSIFPPIFPSPPSIFPPIHFPPIPWITNPPPPPPPPPAFPFPFPPLLPFPPPPGFPGIPPAFSSSKKTSP